MSESSASIVKVVIVILALAAVAILIAAVVKGGKTEAPADEGDESYSEDYDEGEETITDDSANTEDTVDYEFEDTPVADVVVPSGSDILDADADAEAGEAVNTAE